MKRVFIMVLDSFGITAALQKMQNALVTSGADTWVISQKAWLAKRRS